MRGRAMYASPSPPLTTALTRDYGGSSPRPPPALNRTKDSRAASLAGGRAPPGGASMTQQEQVAAQTRQTPLEVAQHQYDRSAEMLNLDSGIRAILREPARELVCHFPVHMDDGSTQVFTGFRVQ